MDMRTIYASNANWQMLPFNSMQETNDHLGGVELTSTSGRGQWISSSALPWATDRRAIPCDTVTGE